MPLTNLLPNPAGLNSIMAKHNTNSQIREHHNSYRICKAWPHRDEGLEHLPWNR